MNSTPSTLEELSVILADADRNGCRLGTVDISSLDRVIEHSPEDLTVTVEAGITLQVLQQQLAGSGQWLPLDPPHPERSTIRDILDSNASGPRRFGYGTAREHLIGMAVLMADGRLVRSGGRVVKNVAGYDLCRLFTGARGTLGVIVEATFKLGPLPEMSTFVEERFEGLTDSGERIEQVMQSPLHPAVLDLHNLNGGLTLVLGFEGNREDAEWQLETARRFGIGVPTNLDYESRFESGEGAVSTVSVLPSRLVEAVEQLGDCSFVARAGNGSIRYTGATAGPKTTVPTPLMRRVKEAFDPNGVFPGLEEIEN